MIEGSAMRETSQGASHKANGNPAYNNTYGYLVHVPYALVPPNQKKSWGMLGNGMATIEGACRPPE